MNAESFDFKQFFADSKSALLRPTGYFLAMRTTGGIIEPLIKVIIYGFAAGILYFIWGLLNFSSGGGLFGGAVGFMVLIWAVIGSVVMLSLFSLAIIVISSICRGSRDFEAALRVGSSIMVLMPVVALMSVIGGWNETLFMLILIVINLYGLWMLFLGLTVTLKTNVSSTRIVSLIAGVLLVVLILAGTGQAVRVTRDFMKNLKNDDRVTREWFKRMK